LLADRDRVLVLAEPGRSVDPVPVPYPVERVKELPDRLDLALAPPRRLAVPGLVGDGDRIPVDQAGRAAGRRADPGRGTECQRIMPLGRRQFVDRGEVAAGDD